MDAPLVIRHKLLKEIKQALRREGKPFTLGERIRTRVFLEIIDGTDSPQESEAAAETWLGTS